MLTKIVAAIVDTRQLTLYKADGTTIVYKQGDERVRKILTAITPQLVAKGWAEIELETPTTAYQDFEKQSGVVRFFKVARTKLAGLFGGAPVEAAVVGKVPARELIESGQSAVQQTQAVVDEIIANAQPVSHPDFHTDDVAQQGNIVESDGTTKSRHMQEESSHTVVAVVGNTVIPNMERIESHFERASKLGSTVGVENFLKRLAAVIPQRSHSVEDLLKFMERADMPIADDGSIVIYKVLQRSTTQEGFYVDCRSRKVTQRIGSYVCMDPHLIDPNRRNECSSGLHVARRGYIRSFGGDVCVLAKLAPEDAFAVPEYDANKMRVIGYHILAELTDDLYALLKQNKPITELEEGKKLLGHVLAGNHVRRQEEVRITQHEGGGVIITPLDKPVITMAPALKAKVTKRKAKKLAKKAKGKKKVAPAEALANPVRKDVGKTDKPVDPKAVAKTVAGLSRKEQAQKLFKAYQKNPNEKTKAKLEAYRKSVKLGWGALGIDPADLQ